MLANPKEPTYTVIFTTFATKNVKKCPKNWKKSSYELPTELPFLLKSLFRHSVIAHIPCVAVKYANNFKDY